MCHTSSWQPGLSPQTEGESGRGYAEQSEVLNFFTLLMEMNNIPIFSLYFRHSPRGGPSVENLCRVYLAAVSAFHVSVGGYMVFPHPKSKQFLRGSGSSTPFWDVSTVQCRPFEPMASCSPHLLAWKTAFLVVIACARQRGELRALCHFLLRCPLVFLDSCQKRYTITPALVIKQPLCNQWFQETYLNEIIEKCKCLVSP